MLFPLLLFKHNNVQEEREWPIENSSVAFWAYMYVINMYTYLSLAVQFWSHPILFYFRNHVIVISSYAMYMYSLPLTG